jgi:hypothetical protein
MEQDNLIIPIDDAIERFHGHLLSHPRTIFSAGFGEGKSYFLKRCNTDMSDVCFITIYPINYQVLENKDIFDVIKRDILFQLFLNGIITSKSPISESVAVYFFIQENISNCAEWLVKGLSNITYPQSIASKIYNAGKSILTSINKKYDSFCKDHNINDANMLDFYEHTNSKAIYEPDAISAFISESISAWRKRKGNKNRRIVLLIEDLDRIDPAHLFRILNVLSAQIDICYYLDNKSNIESYNKFGFDNIVCVLDYDNLHCIYHHFYGELTSAEGYISKFANRGIFNYSLNDEKANYMYKLISQYCSLDIDIATKLVYSDILANKSMRTLVGCFDNVDSQISIPPTVCINNVTKALSLNILRLVVIIRRLGVSDKDIVNMLSAAFKEEKYLHDIILPYVFLENSIQKYDKLYFGEKDDNGYSLVYDFTDQKNNDDKFNYSRTRMGNDIAHVDCSITKIINILMSYTYK